MPFAVTGKIEGLQSAFRRLDAVTKAVRKKVARQAVTKGCRLLAKAAKAKAVKKSGLLRKSIGFVVKVQKGGVVVGRVGPRRGYKQEVVREGRTVLSDPVRYAHLVELGTAHSRPFPFLRAGFESAKGHAAEVIRQAIEEGIAKAAGG